MGVVVTDTAGRAWRVGQTDIAIGAAGLAVVDDHAGRVDSYGNLLAVTLPAVADEIAGAAELATGKLSLSPLSVVRGLGALVLPRGEDGPGAVALVRPEREDMFGLGVQRSGDAALSVLSAPARSSRATPGSGLPSEPGSSSRPWRRPRPHGAGSRGRPGDHLRTRTGSRSTWRPRPRPRPPGPGRAEVVVGAAAAAHGWRLATLSGTRADLVPAPFVDSTPMGRRHG